MAPGKTGTLLPNMAASPLWSSTPSLPPTCVNFPLPHPVPFAIDKTDSSVQWNSLLNSLTENHFKCSLHSLDISSLVKSVLEVNFKRCQWSWWGEVIWNILLLMRNYLYFTQNCLLVPEFTSKDTKCKLISYWLKALDQWNLITWQLGSCRVIVRKHDY